VHCVVVIPVAPENYVLTQTIDFFHSVRESQNHVGPLEIAPFHWNVTAENEARTCTRKLRNRVKAMGIEEVITARKSPWQNG
jgi:pyruvate-formate lyase-activating enzyme